MRASRQTERIAPIWSNNSVTALRAAEMTEEREISVELSQPWAGGKPETRFNR